MKVALVCMSLALALAGCGGTSSQGAPGQAEAPAPEETSGATAECESEGDDHSNAPADVVAFHGVFGPVWHAEEGSDRVGLACQQASVFSQSAAAVKSMTVPVGISDLAAWQAAAAQLVSSTGEYESACGLSPQPAADEMTEKLTAVHHAFHSIVEQLHSTEENAGEAHQE